MMQEWVLVVGVEGFIASSIAKQLLVQHRLSHQLAQVQTPNFLMGSRVRNAKCIGRVFGNSDFAMPSVDTLQPDINTDMTTKNVDS